MGAQYVIDLLSNLTTLCQAYPYFGANWGILVAVLTNIITVYGCRLYGYQHELLSVHHKGV